MAQKDKEKEKADKKSRWAALLNVDLMVDTYTSFLARKYDLTEEQGNFTKQLLHQKAADFMGQNGDNVRDLVERLFDVRTGAEMDPSELVQWGKRAMPLYEEAKKQILDGNTQWREILNEQQRAIHDEDVRLMRESFESTEAQLNRISSGEMTVDEFRRPPRQRKGDSAGGPKHANRQDVPPPQAPQPVPQSAEPPQAPTAPPIQVARGAGESPDGPAVNVQSVPANPQPIPANPQPPVSESEVVSPPEEGVPDDSQSPESPEDMEKRKIEEADQQASEQVQQQESPPEQPDQPPGQPTQPPVITTPERRTSGLTKGGSADFEGRWDTYTREFIARYKLDPAQTQKANDILKSCKEQAHQYLKGHEAQIKVLDARLAAGKSGGRTSDNKAGDPPPDAKATAAERSKNQSELNEQRAKLLAPIEQIFEKQLKPRLDQLPTRAQRTAAEAGGAKSGKKNSDSKSRSGDSNRPAPTRASRPPSGGSEGRRSGDEGRSKPTNIGGESDTSPLKISWQAHR